MSESLLLVFVKHPAPGQVKTRLAASVGDEMALRIYSELLLYTRALAQGVRADKAVFYGNVIPAEDLWEEVLFPRYQQEGADLGERMANAFRWGFEEGYQKVVIIGSDCATLTVDILEEAYDRLDKADFVLGPARDGGYYLLGMKMFFEPVFYNKVWSSESVLSATLADIDSIGKSYHLLPELADVDTIDDLKSTFLEKYLHRL